MKNRSWEDENGVKKYATDIQGDNMTMLGSKRESDPSNAGYVSPAENNNTEPTINTNNNTSNPIEDLPFS